MVMAISVVVNLMLPFILLPTFWIFYIAWLYLAVDYASFGTLGVSQPFSNDLLFPRPSNHLNSSRIAIVTYSGTGVPSHGANLSNHVSSIYSSTHGYQFWESGEKLLSRDWRAWESSLDSQVYHKKNHWAKIVAIYDALERKDVEWVFWLDSDAIFMRHDIRLESFIPPEPIDFVVSKDSSTHINTGVMLLRNTEWSRRFLRDCWADLKQYYSVGEQGTIESHLAMDHNNQHVKYLSIREWNSHSNSWLIERRYRHGDFIVHAAGDGRKHEKMAMFAEVSLGLRTSYPWEAFVD